MSFAELFSRLDGIKEDVKIPDSRGLTSRNEAENGKRSNARKRNSQDETTGPPKTRRCYQGQISRTYHHTAADSNAKQNHEHTDGEHAGVGLTQEDRHSHSIKAGHKNMCARAQNWKTGSNLNVNEQQGKKRRSNGKNTQHQQKDGGRRAYRGGSHRGRAMKHGNDRTQDFQQKRPRFMMPEFKEQNALEVDGRLLCRHFLLGRCIKGDNCQMEHVQGYNDLIKELCKFYVQGFCTKGESCLYMHKSFPCKFFHRRGKCFQGEDCRFSHDPLNDVTTKLLDEALQRESDLNELAKKAELNQSGQPENAEESEIMEANETPDIVLQSLRPNFYKSADTSTEQEASVCPSEGVAENTEEADPRPTNPDHSEPVCYSVEAVLGPQLSKPYANFATSQESIDLSPTCTSGSANANEVPYSVDVVLRSCKIMENSTFGQTKIPPPGTVSCPPNMYFEGISSPLSRSETQSNQVAKNEANESERRMSKNLSSLHVHTGLILKTSPEAAHTASHEAKTGGLSTDTPPCLKGKDDGVHTFAPTKHESTFSRPFRQTPAPKHSAQLEPLASAPTAHSRASFSTLCPSSVFKEFKGRSAASGLMKSSDCANSVRLHLSPKQTTVVHMHSKKTGLSPGSKQQQSPEAAAERSSKMAQKIPFHNLFASPITDTLQPGDDSATSSSHRQESIQSSSAAPQPDSCRIDHLKTPPKCEKVSAPSFLSLFAAPLSDTPLSQPNCSQTSSCSPRSVQSDDNTSKRRASTVEAPLPVPRSPNLSFKAKKDRLSEDTQQPVKSPVNPDSVSEQSAPSTSCADVGNKHQQLPQTPPPKAAAAKSVLKTLFVCLSPYQEDGEQQGSTQIAADSEKDKSTQGIT